VRLSANAAIRSALLDLERTNTILAERQRDLASGRRIHTASDDPGGAAAAVRGRAEIGNLDRYARASDSLESRLSVVDSVLSDLVSHITAAKTSAAGASNSGLSAVQREAAATTLESIRDALFSSFSTRVAGTYVFSGIASTQPPYVKNPDGTVAAYQGNAGTASIDIDRAVSVQATFSADAILRGSDAANLFSELDNLAAAIRAGDVTGIDAGRDALDRAFERAVATQAQVGISLRSIDTGRVQIDARRRASTQEVSRHEDANLAKTVTDLAAADTAYQAAIGALGRTSQLSLLDYLR